MECTSKPEGRTRVGPAVAVILLAVHVGLVLRSYPPSVLVRGEIPLKGDVSRYFATAHGAARVGGLFGYDPHFMAGYPVGLWNSMGKKGFEIAHMLLPWLSLPVLFYVVIVIVCLAAPLVTWLALRQHCPSRRCSCILFVLCLVYWHLDTNISYFWDFGNVFFPAMSCMVVVLASLVWNVVRKENSWFSAVSAGIVAALIFYCHTVVLLAATVPVLCILLACRRKISEINAWLLPSVSLIVFTLLTVWWLVPLLQDSGSCLSQPEEWFQAGPKHLVMDVFSDRAYKHHWDRTFLFHVVLVLGIAGIWLNRGRFGDRPSMQEVLGGGGIAALIITYGFSYVPLLSSVQPHRFIIPATILFLFPASVCIDWMGDIIEGSPRQVRIVVGILLLIMLPQFTGYLIDRAGAPMACGSSPAREQIMKELSTLNVRGRVLCDDSDLGRMIPYRTGIPVIGGLSAQAFVKHRFAGFDDHGVLFGRSAEAWSAADLKSYLDAYAVEWAVLSRAEWVQWARRNEAIFQGHSTHGHFGIFAVVDPRPELEVDGAALVCPDYGLVDVGRVTRRNLLLKLHYSDMLRATDGVKLEAENALDDPVPFVRCVVPEGVTQFRIEKK